MSRVVFLVLPGVQVVDLAGPVQVFHQANLDGAGYETEFVGVSGEAESAQGLFLSRLGELDAVAPGKADTVFVPGTDESRLAPGDLAYLGEAALPWLRRAHEAGARLCAVCTGAFVLAEAGLLDDRCCTPPIGPVSRPSARATRAWAWSVPASLPGRAPSTRARVSRRKSIWVRLFWNGGFGMSHSGKGSSHLTRLRWRPLTGTTLPSA